MATQAPKIEVYLGSPPTNTTEQELLTRLTSDLLDGATDAVVLANFVIGPKSLQIDLVVATQQSAAVVEVKGYTLPVTGELNGPWTQHFPNGTARTLGSKNPYQQAAEARYAIVDALVTSTNRTKEELRRQVDGLVCVLPTIPLGSKLPGGDYKAWIGDYSRLLDLIGQSSQKPLSLDDWRMLARALHLEAADSNKSAADKLLLEEYRFQFKELRLARAQPFVEIHAVKSGEPTTESTLLKALINGRQLHVVGGSGCGKSFLLERLGVSACDVGLLPIAISAHRFEVNLEPLLKRAAATCTGADLPRLIRASKNAGSPIVLFVDALNECPSDKKSALIEALQAARLKFGMRIVTSDQEERELPPSLVGDVIHLAQPDRKTAKQIVEIRLARPLKESEEQALDIVATANDAAILAEVIRIPSAADSRYALYRAFARRQLGDNIDSRTVHSALAALSAHMHDHFATSIPGTTTYRILAQHTYGHSHPGVIEQLAIRSGLIVDQDGFIRFRHDLISNYFAAEHLLAKHSNANVLGNVLARPLYQQLGEFVVGGCGTAAEIGNLLKANSSNKLLLACLRRICGSSARDFALGQSLRLLDQLVARFTRLHVQVPEPATGETHFPGLQVDFSASPAIDDELQPYLEALPFTIREELLSSVLEAFRKIDIHLKDESERLRDLYPEWRLRWFSEVSGTIYGAAWRCKDRSFHRIFSSARSASFERIHNKSTYDRIVTELGKPETLSVGQLFFLVESIFGFDDFNAPPPANLLDIMACAWSQRVYHLALHAIDLGQRFGRRLDNDERKQVGELLESWLNNSNPMLNGMILDVLGSIDCLTPQTSLEDAIAGFKEVLAMKTSDETSDLALRLYGQTIDHPEREVFSEAFYDGLTENERLSFLARAAGAEDRVTMFMSFIIADLARMPTLEAVPALLRHSLVPTKDTMSLQDSVSIFANAIGALAKLRVALPEPGPDQSSAATAWRKAAELIHGFNNPDSPRDLSDVWEALEALHSHAIDPIWWLEGSAVHWIKVEVRFLESFPNGVLRLCRKALAPDYSPESIFGDLTRSDLLESHIGYALTALGKRGSPADIELIRPWIEHTKLGDHALRAARLIEHRSHNP